MKSYGFVLEQVVLLSLPLTTLSSFFFVCFFQNSVLTSSLPAVYVCVCVYMCVCSEDIQFECFSSNALSS